MKSSIKAYVLATATFISLSSCYQTNSNNHTTDSTSIVKAPISIEPLSESDDFKDAKLSLLNVKSEMLGTDSAKVNFTFDVKNYELTKQTTDEHASHCANSEKGQHIHFILDNKPYDALYKPEHTKNLALNSEHYLLCFLSRSYHLSVKSPEASFLIKFKIDEKGNYVKLSDPTSPMLFYSRPKGEYAGKDIQNILLDFYVKNTSLSANASRVKVSIADTTFTVDKWQPYFIKNAPMGDLNLKIELLDTKGNVISGDNTSIERTVTIKQ